IAWRDALKETLSPETLRTITNQALAGLPRSKKKPNKTWNTTSELKLKTLKRIKLERAFTLNAVKIQKTTSLTQLSFTTQLTNYQPARSTNSAFQIANNYLTETAGKGSIDVDLDAGRPLNGDSTMKLTDYLTLHNTDVLYHIQLTQKQTITIKIMDQLPTKKK